MRETIVERHDAKKIKRKINNTVIPRQLRQQDECYDGRVHSLRQ